MNRRVKQCTVKLVDAMEAYDRATGLQAMVETLAAMIAGFAVDDAGLEGAEDKAWAYLSGVERELRTAFVKDLAKAKRLRGAA